jgi:hypothetical protein
MQTAATGRRPEEDAAGRPGDERPRGGSRAEWAVRAVLVAAQAATVLMTWRVWEPRTHPPMLPLVHLPDVHAGWPMLASLAVALPWPRIGVPLHTAVLAVAIVADQSRMQPHLLSLATLLWGTTGWAGGRIVARAGLGALWCYAGIHKATSPPYYTTSGAWMLRAVCPGGPAWLGPVVAAAVAGTEIFLGVGCFVPRIRRAAAVAAVPFHLATFSVLAFRLGWDAPVWPWNLALAVAGPAFLMQWRGPGLGGSYASAGVAARVAAVTLLVLPLGYWLGVVDAFLAHCVYADNRPRAYVCTPFSRTELDQLCQRLGVALPPAHRHYAPLFRGIGRPGEWLEIEDPRWVARWFGFSRRTISWQDVADPADTP